MTTFADGLNQYGGMPVGHPVGMGIGNIYYVVSSTTSAMYTHMQKKFGGKRYHNDNTNILHTTIASALAVTVSEREDYVLVCSDSADYDLAGVGLEMAARNSHLICPGGLGANGMMNPCRLDNESATGSTVELGNQCQEVAGFFFRGYQGQESLISTVAGGTWTCNIHDNFFALSATNGNTGYGLSLGISHAFIHHNFMNNYSPGLMTGADNEIESGMLVEGTRNVITDNILVAGANTVWDYGIQCWTNSSCCVVARNYVLNTPAQDASQAGVITYSIYVSADSIAIDNRCAVADAGANALTGGTADGSFIFNYISSNGGTQVE